MAETWQTYSTFTAATRAMAGGLLSTRCLNHYWNESSDGQSTCLQKQYITQLSQLHELKDIQKIQVRLRVESQTPPKSEKPLRTLSPETQDMLRGAADFVSDPKLSQALLRLASNKK